jgi:hypothetical protein
MSDRQPAGTGYECGVRLPGLDYPADAGPVPEIVRAISSRSTEDDVTRRAPNDLITPRL